jgi:hypothetical protein
MTIDEKTLREIVRNEIDNSSVRKAIEGLEKPSISWKDVLRHPLFLTLAAFTLTTFVGGTLERKYRNKAEIRASEVQAIDALNEFITLANSRTVETDLLRSAIRRQSKDEVVERKRNYDAAYKIWNVNFSTNMIRLRSSIAQHPENSMDEQGVYEKVVILSIAYNFKQADACITAAYDQSRKSNFGDISDFRSSACHNTSSDGQWHEFVRNRTEKVSHCAQALQDFMGREIRLISAERLAGKYEEGIEGQPDTFGFTRLANGRKKTRIASSHKQWRLKVVEDFKQSCPGIAY